MKIAQFHNRPCAGTALAGRANGGGWDEGSWRIGNFFGLRSGQVFEKGEVMMFRFGKSSYVAMAAALFAVWTSPAISQDYTQSGSTLLITGSTGSDNLSVTGGAAGAVVVTDNENAEVETFSNISRINIDLRGGNDLLSLSNIDLNGGLISARLGADNDSVVVTGSLDADVILDGELGDDDVDLSGGVTVLGSLDIYGGIRDDVIDLTGVGVNGDLWIDAQAGDDDLTFDGLAVGGRTRIDLGAGVDFATGAGAVFDDDVVLIAGLGNDDILNSLNTYNGDLTVDLRGGDDDYAELDSFVNGDYRVDGGAGNDDFNDTGTIVLGSRSSTSVLLSADEELT